MKKIFYHNDADGKASAAIVSYAIKSYEKLYFKDINYNKGIDIDSISPDDDVIVLDYSNTDEIKKIKKQGNKITWIDHHVSAIENSDGLKGIAGIRDSSEAACILTWKYYLKDLAIPHAIELIADNDIWTYKWGEKTRAFKLGFSLLDTDPQNWDVWKKIFLNDKTFIEDIVNKGRICIVYQETQNYFYRVSYSFDVMFEGYHCRVCNIGQIDSWFWGDLINDYDILIGYVFDGKGNKVSMRTTKNIDLHKIAMKYSGGGHRKAAGFSCKELPFI